MLHPHHHALMFFFIILLFSSLNYSQSLTTHADDERAILLSLKRHWGNPSSLHHWNSTFSPCDDWPEILCNSNGSVKWIYLSGMNLQGSFPSKIICQLNSLSSINLGTNYLWGTIPVGLSSCSKLEDLDLSVHRPQLRLQARTIMPSTQTSSTRCCCDNSGSRWRSCSNSGTDSGVYTTSSIGTNFSNSGCTNC